MDLLQGRGDDNIVYAPNESEPYSGWAKRMHEVDFDFVDVPSPQVAELYRIDAGRRSSRFAWYENGRMESEEHYEAGERTGRWVAWYENGQMESEEHYEAGERRGLRTVWDSDGEKEIEFDYDANSFTVGIGPVAQLPLTSSGPLSADTQFVFETAPGCTRVEVSSASSFGRQTIATLSNVWTGEKVLRRFLPIRGELYSETINDALREHYRLHLEAGSRQPSSYQLEVAATNCDD